MLSVGNRTGRACRRSMRSKGRGLKMLRQSAASSIAESWSREFEASPSTQKEEDIADGDIDGAEEEICELLGYDLGESLIRQVGKQFSESERTEARRLCGFETAETVAQPQAIWLIGPSASGKSTLAPKIAAWVGAEDQGYALVDGEPFRDSHRGYQAALTEGKQQGCVWWGAYVGIRENVNKEKQAMLEDAVEAKKNLVIPSTCLRSSQSVDVAEMLLGKGYLVHIVAVYGEKEEIVKRGRRRAMEKGKRYDPREFELALQAFAPMLKLCNGQYRMVCTTIAGAEPCVATDEGQGPISDEEIQRICDKVYAVYSAESCDLVDDSYKVTSWAALALTFICMFNISSSSPFRS